MTKQATNSLTPINIALETLLSKLPRIEESEQIDILDARGRVLAADFVSDQDVPPHNNSAMDGYALRSEDQGKQQTSLRVSQRIAAGQVGEPLQAGEAARIFTGAPLPAGADAVVMQENCAVDGDHVTLLKAVSSGENMRLAGEDVRRGSVLLKAGHRLVPQDIGLLASSGSEQIAVRRRLKVALMTTGDELVKPGAQLGPGQIYNSNYFSLAALLQSLEIEVVDIGVVADDLDGTRKALQQASATADCVITTGGVSVGEEDYVKAAVESLGQLDLWKLAIKPGKPFAFGSIGSACFFGLPGNPVSAFVTFVLLVRPCLLTMLGCEQPFPRQFSLPAGFARAETGQRQEYIRVSLAGGATGSTELQPYDNQSSGVGASLSHADGLAIIPPYTKVIPGDSLSFIPFSEVIN